MTDAKWKAGYPEGGAVPGSHGCLLGAGHGMLSRAEGVVTLAQTTV